MAARRDTGDAKTASAAAPVPEGGAAVVGEDDDPDHEHHKDRDRAARPSYSDGGVSLGSMLLMNHQ